MKKIVFLLYTLDPGGLETKLLRFLQYYNGKVDATVLIKNGKLGILEEDFKKCNAQLLPLKGGYLNIYGWFRFYKVFRRGNFESLCDFTGNFSGIYIFIAKFAGIKNRIAYYGQASNHFKVSYIKNIYNKIVNWLVFLFATTIISNSKTALNFFFQERWLTNNKFKIVNNGIDIQSVIRKKDFLLHKELGISNSAKIIVNAARYDIKKNHVTVLRLGKWLVEKGVDVFIVCCGIGTENLNFKIEEMNLSRRVFALGYRSDIGNILGNSDAFYFPSFTEGQPNALIEAIVSGLPFVASDIGAIKEVIPIEYHNHLVEPNDYLSAGSMFLALFDGAWCPNTKELQNWAIEKFDSRKRFIELYNLL